MLMQPRRPSNSATPRRVHIESVLSSSLLSQAKPIALFCVAALVFVSGQLAFASDRDRPLLDLPAGGATIQEEDPAESRIDTIVAFGHEFESSTFAFCLDRSLSITHAEFTQLCAQVVEVIDQLSDTAKFNVVAFGVQNVSWRAELGSGSIDKESAKNWVTVLAKECMPGSVQIPPAMVSIRESLGDADSPVIVMFTSVMGQCQEATAMAASMALGGCAPVHVIEIDGNPSTSIFANVLATETGGSAKVVCLD